MVEGTETGTVTDMDGNFTIQVPEGATLLFSYIGFLNEQVVVSTQTNLEIQLLPDLAELDEVVVIGYGQVRKKDLTGSVATVSSDDFKQGAVTSPEQLIVGKISGVQITSGGGDPGSKQNIRIRGGASINASNDPLYVVDGIPLDNDDADGLANPFSSLNPNDIESISVLKDASATAIYGSRASNGVIIITTKKGTAHAPLKLSYNGKFSINQVTKKVDVLDADQFREAVSTYVSESNRDNAISLLGNESTEWQDEIYRNSYDMEHSFSASGAINKLPYRVSVGYLSQDGILKTGYMDRTTLRASISPSLFDDHLQLNINASGAWLENRFANKDAIGAAVQFDPTKPVYEDNNFNGYYAWTTPDTIPAAERVRTVGQATKNPVALLEEKEDRSNVYRTTGNFSADYKLHFLPELKLHVNAGYDGYHSDGTIEVPATSAIEFDNAENPKGGGTLRDYSQSKENTLLDVYLNYNRELNSVESRIDATAGYSYQKFWKISKTFETNHIPTANDSVLKKDTDGAQEAVLISFFGRLNYSLKDKYLVTFTLREDGSSR
ncbi:MAG: SusC/RagA family TonB-linked outer membrane protein, partial [Desulfobacterales bacterium]|nr:SusC/RagA family TonB-linked outer membrane protein [Desulfobacterales bacterium]